MSTALVLGGGLAGLLAAAALAPHARQVTVTEQGNLPDGPEPRREVPQGHFGHILLGGGADALDSLLPGTVDALRAAGAHHRQIRTCRSTLNRRRFHEDGAPAGFTAVGDAVAALNPVYGHGMTVAAQCAAAIRAVLRIEGLHPGVGASIQRRVAQVVDTPWTMAEEQDRGFPGVKSNSLSANGPMDRLARWYGDRLARAALTDPAVSAAYFDVFALTAPAARLAAPAVAFAALRPCRRRPPTAAEAIGRHRRVTELAGHP